MLDKILFFNLIFLKKSSLGTITKCFFPPGIASSKADEVEKHLELGKHFLSQGLLQDALSHYHAAVEGDPDNYLTYFKRGTVYLALGKAKFALIDFDKVLQLKPDFKSVRML